MNTKVVLIVGPSGAGKDTLLREAKKYLAEKINFLNRYITRKSCNYENNFYLDESSFEKLKKNNFFISTWHAHNNYYGISKESIKEGTNVISISRSKIKDFENVFRNIFTINIIVSKEELKKRLLNRERESQEEIEKRLNRSYSKIEAKNLIEFDNNGDLNESIKKFCELLKSL